jgi:hypothetical protein
MVHLTFLVIFYLKVIVCQKNYLPHIYDHLKNHLPIYDMIFSNFAHDLKTYSNHMESQCLVDIKILINNFNNFLNIFAFFNTLQCIFSLHKYILTSHHMK